MGSLLTGLARFCAYSSFVLRCGFSVFRCGRAFTLEHIPFHLGASGLSLDLGFSSFFLGGITPGLSLSSREFAREGSAFACPFCVFEFGTLVACLTLRVRALEKTPSHYGRGYWRRV